MMRYDPDPRPAALPSMPLNVIALLARLPAAALIVVALWLMAG